MNQIIDLSAAAEAGNRINKAVNEAARNGTVEALRIIEAFNRAVRNIDLSNNSKDTK
jgi:hypothetical protein